jgi:uncharacterized protein involved in propanediol utilization
MLSDCTSIIPIPDSDRAINAGMGTAIAQHGELFQGVSRDDQGVLHRCLLSLPCPQLSSRGHFLPADIAGIIVRPPTKQKARYAAELCLSRLGSRFKGGTLWIESNIPESKGLGSSTADCTAAVRAVANCLQKQLTPRDIAELVVGAESASGNIMFDTAVLFAHREGKVLEHYLQPLPRMVVLGFDADADGLVETLQFPPAVYSAEEVEKFKVLRAALRRAVHTQDVTLLGRIATASAEINQRFLQKPRFHEICGITQKSGAAGVAVAHSGTVAGILFDHGDPERESKIAAASKLLASLDFENILRFEN